MEGVTFWCSHVWSVFCLLFGCMQDWVYRHKDSLHKVVLYLNKPKINHSGSDSQSVTQHQLTELHSCLPRLVSLLLMKATETPACLCEKWIILMSSEGYYYCVITYLSDCCNKRPNKSKLRTVFRKFQGIQSIMAHEQEEAAATESTVRLYGVVSAVFCSLPPFCSGCGAVLPTPRWVFLP